MACETRHLLRLLELQDIVFVINNNYLDREEEIFHLLSIILHNTMAIGKQFFPRSVPGFVRPAVGVGVCYAVANQIAHYHVVSRTESRISKWN